MKKEKQEEQPKVEAENPRTQEELVPPPTPEPDVDPEEELELSAEGEDDAVDEKTEDIVRWAVLFRAHTLYTVEPRDTSRIRSATELASPFARISKQTFSPLKWN